MKIEWVETKDKYNTETAQLCYNNVVLVELVKFADENQVYVYSDIMSICTQDKCYFEDMSKAKKAIEDSLHNFCVEFNTWWQR